MLEFILNGEGIPLKKETSIKLTWSNPACKFNEIPGDVGLGIDIEVNEYTRHIFGHSERFEKSAAGNDREFPGFEVRFSGMLLHSGTLIITDADETKYNGYIRGNVGNIGKAERGKLIGDNSNFDKDFNFENKAYYQPGTDLYCFPKIKNTSFFSGIGSDNEYEKNIDGQDDPEKYKTTALAYWFNESNESYMNSKDVYGFIQSVESIVNIGEKSDNDNASVNAVVPMFYLNYVIREVLKSHGFFVKENFLETHPQFKHLCVFNNFDITPISALSATTQNIFKFNSWDDWYASATRSAGIEIDAIQRNELTDITFPGKNHLPQVTLADFLLGIQNLTNTCLHIKNNKSVNIIDREGIITGDSFDLNDFFVGDWILGEKKNTTLKFVMEHDNNDLVFSERWHDLSENFEDIKDPVDNWEDLEEIEATPGEIRFILNDHVYAKYGWYTESVNDPDTSDDIQVNKLGWEEVSICFQNGFYNYGQAEIEEIKTCFSTLLENPAYVVVQEGAINYKNYTYKNFTPRLIYDSLSHIQDQSLDWYHYRDTFFFTGDVGLISQRYKYWAPFWCNRLPVKASFQVPLNVIYYIINNITQKYRTREGEFIIDNLSVEFKGNIVGPATIEGFKI